MAARQRKSASGKRCSYPRRDGKCFAISACNCAIFYSATGECVPESHTTPAMPSYKQRQKRTRSIRGKLLPGAVAGSFSHCTLINMHDCAYCQAERQFPPSAAPANLRRRHQSPLRADRFTALQFQLLKIIMASSAISEVGTRNVTFGCASSAATTPVAGQCFPPYSQAAVA